MIPALVPALGALALLSFAAPAVPAALDDPVERAKAWPELSRDDEETVELDIERVRNAHTPEMAEQGASGIVAVGPGATPYLVPLLGKERDEAALARLLAVVDEITDERHTRLIAAWFDDGSDVVRKWALERAALFPDPGIREAAEKALATQALYKEKKSRKYDEDEHFVAALAATSAGSLEGLELIVDVAAEGWGERGKKMHVALTGARGPEATKRVVAKMKGADRQHTVAALHVLAACGTKDEAVPAVKPHLDSKDNSIRVAAINALRGIVDGDPPIEKLSVFDAIELAKQWKSRV